MDIFKHAIAHEGGISALARALGLRSNRVFNWVVRGVPDGWMTVMQDRYGAKTLPQGQRKLPGKAVVSATK